LPRSKRRALPRREPQRLLILIAQGLEGTRDLMALDHGLGVITDVMRGLPAQRFQEVEASAVRAVRVGERAAGHAVQPGQNRSAGISSSLRHAVAKTSATMSVTWSASILRRT
jgi:hypothetical protein